MQLAYGSQLIEFAFDDRFEVLASRAPSRRPLTDLEIGEALDRPIESLPLEQLVAPGDSVLIVASDATRACQRADYQPVVAASFSRNLSRPRAIISQRDHRRQGREAGAAHAFITQRIRFLTTTLYESTGAGGETERGTQVELKRALRIST